MQKIKSLTLQFGLSATLIFLGRLSQLLMYFFLAKQLPASDFGFFSIVIISSQIFAMMLTFGALPTAQKIIPGKISTKRTNQAAVFLRYQIDVCILSIIIMLVTTSTLTSTTLKPFIPISQDLIYSIGILSSAFIISSFREFLCRSLGETFLAIFPRDIAWTATVIAVTLCSSMDVTNLMTTIVLILFIIEAITIIIIQKKNKTLFKFCKTIKPLFNYKRWVKPSTHYFSSSLGGMAFERIDVLTVSIVSTLEQVALYNLASRFSPILSITQRFITPILIPKISTALANNQKRAAAKEVIKGVIVASSYSLPLFIIGYYFADIFLGLFGAFFINATNIFQTLLFGHVIISIGSCFGAYILASNYSKAYGYCIWASLSTTLTILLIQRNDLTPEYIATIVVMGIALYNIGLICSVIKHLTTTKPTN